MRRLSHVMSECSLSGRGIGPREQFLHCGLRKFRHSKSSVYRWYTQLDRRRFVYDTYKTMKATRTRHGWVHMFTTHRPTLTLQLHNFNLFRTCRTALLRDNWQDFNWHDVSRGPSAIAELLVFICQKNRNQKYAANKFSSCSVELNIGLVSVFNAYVINFYHSRYHY